MVRFVLVILTGLLTSFFLFPFNLPIEGLEVNTKMIEAVLGIVLFAFDLANRRHISVSRDFLILCLICFSVSIWALFVSALNNTADYTYATYFISVWVWLGAVYTVLWMMRQVHSRLTVECVAHYLISICLAQCLLAYAMTIWPDLGTFIDSLMGEGQGFMGLAKGRMHGLGAALDPSGLRFAAILVIIACLYTHLKAEAPAWKICFYTVSFIVITVIGNMIARSTTIGAIIGLVYIIMVRWPKNGTIADNRSWGIVGGILLIGILVSIWLYNNDAAFKHNLRFGFEGFFSLFETGQWEVRSNEILKNMIVWPETLKTWVLGDGYFSNPDIPDRFGQVHNAFYMGTDIGYLRYIFYFGIVGLSGLIAVFVNIILACIRAFPSYKYMFLLLLLTNFVGWSKVSSDIIMVMAPFLIVAYQKGIQETA